jgi:NTP pyrophosphatase (non-canonical NTP hydrolase)
MSEVTQDMRLDEYWSPEHFGNRQTVNLSLVDFPFDIVHDYDPDVKTTFFKNGTITVYLDDVAYSRSVSDMVAEFTKKKVGSDLWIDLIWEEAQELFEAYDKGDEYNHDLIKEMADLVYVVHGLANELGWDLDEAIKRVHASNMSKLDNNGEPIYNEAGKRQKGPNYKAPDLKDLV